jgi:lipopolysaccharide export LptBFGC system permease protein LptF
MVAELDSISDPTEQTRFAIGAMMAIARLAVSGYARSPVDAVRLLVAPPGRGDDTSPGGPSMSALTTRELLRRHAAPFVIFLGSLTLLLVANQVVRWVPRLTAGGASIQTIAEVLLLSVPFTLALTVPMAVFLSVSWVFTRLGKEGLLASTRRQRHHFRRLAGPVVVAAGVIAAMTLVCNGEILPRANSRLVAVLTGGEGRPTERTMTIGELHQAARSARNGAGAYSDDPAAMYEVELQKRIALAAACIVLALAGAAIVVRFPRGGVGLVIAASGVVFTAYYASLVAGESLADRQLISPGLAMWTANALLLAVSLALAWGRGDLPPESRSDTFAIGESGAA